MIKTDDFNELKSTILRECKGKNVYYLPNPGNWGDGLIRYGTIKFFKEIGLQYKELSPNKKDWILPFLQGGVVIYGGGGAWCSNWENNYVKKLSKRFKVIVLPSSYEFEYNFNNVIFYARDKFQSIQNTRSALFTHDMAFYIGDEFYTGNKGEGIGYFFREDSESANIIQIPEENTDISHKGNHLTTVSHFFKELDSFQKIYTDRLHVAIASVLLRKEVHLYPGNYFKIEAIYESSLKPYFSNINFHRVADEPQKPTF